LQELASFTAECPDICTLSHPHDVEHIARAYVEAGSQIVLTNTFGSNRVNLTRHGYAQKTREMNQHGVALSRRAANGKALVFGSMGPSGKMLVMGETTEEELTAAFAEQAAALQEAGADGIAIETMTDLDEAKLAVAAAKQTGLPVVACMAFDSGKDKDRTMMGVNPEQAAAGLEEAGADVIGANCGQGIEGFISICKRLRAATPLPIWIKPNAGLPTLSHGHAIYATKPEEFARYVPELVKAGANFIGGCCGTNPEFIRAIAESVRA
jgi:methionine synthase I (cobalamin-dependent)